MLQQLANGSVSFVRVAGGIALVGQCRIGISGDVLSFWTSPATAESLPLDTDGITFDFTTPMFEFSDAVRDKLSLSGKIAEGLLISWPDDSMRLFLSPDPR